MSFPAFQPQQPGPVPGAIIWGTHGLAARQTGLNAAPLAKAVMATPSRRVKPDYVHHYVSESVRNYANFSGGIKEDQTPFVHADLLRTLASRNVVLQAVMHTIINQVASHFVRPMTEKSIGIKIRQKEKGKSLTVAAAKEAKRIEAILYQGGVPRKNQETGETAVWDSHDEDEADSLQVAVRKLIRDSLTIDRAYIVTEGSRSAKEPVLYWKHVDGALIRKVDTPSYQPQIRNGNNGSDDLSRRVKYVELAPGGDFRVDREYAWNEGYLSFRNPKCELLAHGYGSSEIEQCLAAVTGILYAMQANQDWFTEDHLPAGLINIFGNFKIDELEDMRAMLAGDVGVGGSIWRTPVLASQPVQGMPAASVTFTPFNPKESFDMVSRTYMELCVCLTAAVFQIAPEEFGFKAFGQAASLNEGNAEDKLQHSQHKGLLPKVLWLCDFFSRGIVERINPDFELVIQGLDAVYNPEQLAKAQLDLALMGIGKTMNDLADQNDEPPVVDPIDEELWDELNEQHEGEFFPTERERRQAILKEYKKQGGKLGNYPNAPVGNPGALQIWVQEHLQQGTDTQAEMGAQATGAMQMGQQNEQMEKQSAQAGMDAQAQQEGEFQQDQRQEDAAAAAKNELRVPMLGNPAFGKGFDPERFEAILKSVRVTRREP